MRLHKALRRAPASTARIEVAAEPALIEWDVRPVGPERVRQLLGGNAPELGEDLSAWTARSFQVRQVVAGRGAWLEELFEHGYSGTPLWVEDPEASEYLEPGFLLSSLMRPNDRVTIPRFWVGCELCEQDRARRHGRHR
ncbi:MAG TPA: hypothetical protein VNB06_01470 [Thermoanaerobaculia bacterium]|nr:hypothetical protein [Thermoanaerobaculia bacterium]